MRTINGFIDKNNIHEISSYENLHNYVEIFSKYFDKIGNNLMNVNLNNDKNIALIYSTVIKLTPCSHSYENIILENNWNFNPASSIFEWPYMNINDIPFFHKEGNESYLGILIDDYIRRLCDNSILIAIKMKNNTLVVGEYCPERNILLGADWTHSIDQLQFVEQLFNKMKEMKLLKEKSIEKLKPKITLGADPEFELIDDDDNIIHVEGSGIPDRVIFGGEGRIGCDASGKQREIRPEPSESPEGLVKNIETLISFALDEKWSLRGEKYSLGGHIHVGGISESTDFISLLDYYLNPLSELNSIKRKESVYGKPGDWRHQEWGMEYRTPPSGWLASKELAIVTLKIVKLAAEKHFYGENIELTENLKNDLISLGLEEKEIILFFSEIEKFKRDGLPNDLKVAWGYAIPNKINISFKDEWSPTVKKYIRSIIKELIKDSKNRTINLYGLSMDRGNVFSISSINDTTELENGYTLIPSIKTGKNSVGFPYKIRHSLLDAQQNKNLIESIIIKTMNLKVIPPS